MKKLVKLHHEPQNTVQTYAACACGCGCTSASKNATAFTKAKKKTGLK